VRQQSGAAVDAAEVRHSDAARHLRAWGTSATRSRLQPYINLARRIRAHFDGIIASVHHGLSNSRLEGINAKIRLINKRGYGHPNYESLTAMVHLCLGDVTIPLPHSCGKARVLRLYAPKKLSEPE
jgi:transposase